MLISTNRSGLAQKKICREFRSKIVFKVQIIFECLYHGPYVHGIGATYNDYDFPTPMIRYYNSWYSDLSFKHI